MPQNTLRSALAGFFPEWMTALAPPDPAPMHRRDDSDAPVVMYGAEAVGPRLAERAAGHGLAIEIWLRAGAGLGARRAFDRAANASLRHVYGPEYLLHNRVGGCHFIVILRKIATGRAIASSVYVFQNCPTLCGFRGWMEQVHSAHRTPDIETLLFEIGHSAIKFLALYDPLIAPRFVASPYITVETALSAVGFSPQDEHMLRSLGYELHTEREHGDDPGYTYRKQIAFPLGYRCLSGEASMNL
jgi:hypothetical protein